MWSIMRKHATVRPANRGHSTPIAFAMVMTTSLILIAFCTGMLAQDAYAQMPSAYMEDGEDGPESDDGDFMAPAPMPDHDVLDKYTKPPARASAPQPRQPVATTKKTAPAPAISKANPVKAATQPATAPAKSTASGTASAPAKAATSSTPSPLEPLTVASRTDDTSDIYGAWAAKKIKNGQKDSTSKPHPLTLDYPSHFVVVCQAGCRTEVQQIVYLEPQDARGPVFETPKENTATETGYVACVGGCYKSGVNTPLYNVGHTDAHGASNSWLSTSPPEAAANGAKKTSGRWYDRMGDSATDTN